MAYESSYDVGLKPFNHDKKRGKWASPMDFLFACIGHAFKLDTMFAVPSIVFRDAGIYGLLLYIVCLTLCTIPIIFIQSFLGQFSSTGFISVFRIAPIFKGIGYAALALNVATLAFYSIYAAIPMFFFIHSMRPTLPWSCEGLHWMKDLENMTTPCNVGKVDFGLMSYKLMQMPSITFIENHLNVNARDSSGMPEWTHSWFLTLCTICVWLVVWAILEKPTEIVGRILRYVGVVTLGILVICFLRFILLPGAFSKLADFANMQKLGKLHLHIFVPIVALAGLGPGWGTILSMASYNRFKTNTTKYTWMLCLGQLGLVVLGSLSCIFIESFLRASQPGNSFLDGGHSQLMKISSIPTGLSMLEMPNFWSLIFFGMVTLGVLSLLVVQLLSVLTSLFDEFEQLRSNRTKVIRISIVVFGLISIPFCSNIGIGAFNKLNVYSVLYQTFLNLFLLLVVLWIYGRERFQHDLYFMTKRKLPTWMVYVFRFITPLFLLVIFALLIVMAANIQTPLTFSVAFSLIIFLAWLLVPGYCIYKLLQTRGSFKKRLKRCVRPANWYPAEMVDRQAYDENFREPQITHQLTAATGNV